MRAPVRLARVGATALLVAVILAGCSTMLVDRAAAERAATAFVAAQAPPGEVMADVRATSVREEHSGARNGWVVEAQGSPRGPGEPEGMAYVYVLFVDGLSGEITLDAQG